MEGNLLSVREAAARLGIKPATLYKYQCQREGGPKFVRIGTRVLYHPAELDAFIIERTVAPVSAGRKPRGSVA
jgi:excisionase family DNA binding protein